jgi:phasin family protein
MTMLTPEQFAGANKAQFDTLFSLTNKAFEGFQKVLALNLQVVKSTLAESQENAYRALSVKDAQELFALQASLAQPVAETPTPRTKRSTRQASTLSRSPKATSTQPPRPQRRLHRRPRVPRRRLSKLRLVVNSGRTPLRSNAVHLSFLLMKRPRSFLSVAFSFLCRDCVND